MKGVLRELQPELVELPPQSLANLNTREDWMAFEEQRG
jgi:hypothetical protein